MLRPEYAKAILQAKSMLDQVPHDIRLRLRAWRSMSSALRGAGDVETAYCVAAKGLKEARQQGYAGQREYNQ